jgi:hypothetical protein
MKIINLVKANSSSFVVMLVGVTAYLGFYPLFQTFQSGAIKELLAAVFAAVIITFITLLQLRQQTNVSDRREKDVKIFEEKLKFFEEYLEVIKAIVLKMDSSSVNYTNEEKKLDTIKIIFILSKLRMHCSKESVGKIGFNLSKILDADSAKMNMGGKYYLMIDCLFESCEVFHQELFPSDKASSTLYNESDISDIGLILKGIKDDFAFADDQDAQESLSKNAFSTDVNVFYTNLGGRSWSDMKKYGFWQAGGTDRVISGLKKIVVGDILCAYSSGNGYVAVGKVLQEATPIGDFLVSTRDGDRIPLLSVGDEVTLQKAREHAAREYCLKVDWGSGVRDFRDAVTMPGVFAAPMTSCRLTHSETLRLLSEKFDFNFPKD